MTYPALGVKWSVLPPPDYSDKYKFTAAIQASISTYAQRKNASAFINVLFSRKPKKKATAIALTNMKKMVLDA